MAYPGFLSHSYLQVAHELYKTVSFGTKIIDRVCTYGKPESDINPGAINRKSFFY